MEFDKTTHTYSVEGVVIPSVTQILEVLGGYEGIPASVLERKAEIGDAAHLATEMYDREELDEESVPAEIAGYFSAYKRFRDETRFHPIEIERRVFSKVNGYAGTLDRSGTFAGLRGVNKTAECLLDIKCTAKLMPSVGPQTAAYAAALTEESKTRIRHRFALLLEPGGTYVLEELSNLDDFAVFSACLRIYRWKMRNKA